MFIFTNEQDLMQTIMTRDYCKCGEEIDYDCNGLSRCPVCDPPCPCCSYGGGYDPDDRLEIVEGMKQSMLNAERAPLESGYKPGPNDEIPF